MTQSVAELRKKYFMNSIGDGIGLRCEACCAPDYPNDPVEWFGNFLMLYPNCVGSVDPETGIPCHWYPHICYGYPLNFAYPLLVFLGGPTTDTAYYPELWLGSLDINGNTFDLTDPAEFGVNKNGVGIVKPQQYGFIDDTGRYWSKAGVRNQRLVEHLPDVVLYPNCEYETLSIGYAPPGSSDGCMDRSGR